MFAPCPTCGEQTPLLGCGICRECFDKEIAKHHCKRCNRNVLLCAAPDCGICRECHPCAAVGHTWDEPQMEIILGDGTVLEFGRSQRITVFPGSLLLHIGSGDLCDHGVRYAAIGDKIRIRNKGEARTLVLTLEGAPNPLADELWKHHWLTEKIHPECRPGEEFLLNVHIDEEGSMQRWAATNGRKIRLGERAYATAGTEPLPNMRPLFADKPVPPAS